MNTLVFHEINLSGLELHLESSIYIERCPAAGACATNSIYIALKLINQKFIILVLNIHPTHFFVEFLK